MWPRLCAELDYTSASRSARTSRTLAAHWRHYVIAIDVCARLKRFYRGVALRHSVTLLRAHPRVFSTVERSNASALVLRAPHVPFDTSDAECIAETVRFGLAADNDELCALVALGVIDPTHTLLARSRYLIENPQRVPTTNVHTLVPHGNCVLRTWRAHGAAHGETLLNAVVCRDVSPLDWWPTSDEIGEDDLTHGERVRAHAVIVNEYVGGGHDDAVRGSLMALPQLVCDYVMRAQRTPSRYAPLDDIEASAAELVCAMLTVVFGVRYRVPRHIDTSDAWLYAVRNGPVDNKTSAIDARLAVPRWCTMHNGVTPREEVQDLAGFFACARHYGSAKISTPYTSVVSRECAVLLRALRVAVAETRLVALKQQRHSARGGLAMRAARHLCLPSPLHISYAAHTDCLLVTTTHRERIACVQEHTDGSVTIEWAPVALALSACGRPMRCRLLDAFGATTTMKRARNTAKHTIQRLCRPLQRCVKCDDVLDYESGETQVRHPWCAGGKRRRVIDN